VVRQPLPALIASCKSVQCLLWVVPHVFSVQKARVSVDEDGYLNVNDKLQTNIPHIWAVGDVLGHKRMLTPVARMEAFALANHLFPPQEGLQRAPQLDYRNIPSAVCSALLLRPSLSELEFFDCCYRRTVAVLSR
jgi:hypothetical protein